MKILLKPGRNAAGCMGEPLVPEVLWEIKMPGSMVCTAPGWVEERRTVQAYLKEMQDMVKQFSAL